MGISILLIVLFHLPKFDANGIPVINSLVIFVQSIGYLGVDIFFFLSGFGLTFGWLSKNYSLREFYQKRLSKILPTYWYWLTLFFIGQSIIYKSFGFKGFLADLFGIGFLSNKSYNHWFIPAIIICYFSFPLLIKLIGHYSKHLDLRWGIFISILFGLLISGFMILINANKLLIFSTRIPNFMLGALVAYLNLNRCSKNSNSRVSYSPALTFMFCTGSLLLYLIYSFTSEDLRFHYGLWWYPFIFLTLPLCFLITSILKQIYKSPSIKKLLAGALQFCGKYSLEIYLMHSLIFNLMGHDKSPLGLFLVSKLGDIQAMTLITYYFLLISLSLTSAFYFRYFVSFLNNSLSPFIRKHA